MTQTPIADQLELLVQKLEAQLPGTRALLAELAAEQAERAGKARPC